MGRAFNELLQHYALERFLYRLSVSDHAHLFILKGALLLRAWRLSSVRPTRDIDLLGQTSNDVESIIARCRDLCQTPIDDDGLSFDHESLRATPIAGDAEYEGLRVEFEGRLGNARMPMRIDIGFGDQITPEPEEIEYPTVLGMDPPRLRAVRSCCAARCACHSGSTLSSCFRLKFVTPSRRSRKLPFPRRCIRKSRYTRAMWGVGQLVAGPAACGASFVGELSVAPFAGSQDKSRSMGSSARSLDRSANG